jgi:uncharacterized protein YegP (UPF0339 family)
MAEFKWILHAANRIIGGGGLASGDIYLSREAITAINMIE